jgi:hypothetical protein
MTVPGEVAVRVGYMAPRLPYPVNIHLPPIAQPDPCTAPRLSGRDLDIIVPKDEARHTKLGFFLSAWGDLESTLAFLLKALLDISFGEALFLQSKMGMKNTIDFIEAIGMRKLADVDADELCRLTERLGKMNTKRNILVHGRWILEANVIVRRGEAHVITQFLREIEPTDPKEAEAMSNPRNQKERVRYTFTMKRIDAASRDTDKLNFDFINFIQRMKFKALSDADLMDLLAQSKPYRATYSTL